MHEPTVAPAYELFTSERIADLQHAAQQVRVSRDPEADRPGLILRTRVSLGRSLMSLGHTVAGGRA
jgi:hypothetical protein